MVDTPLLPLWRLFADYTILSYLLQPIGKLNIYTIYTINNIFIVFKLVKGIQRVFLTVAFSLIRRKKSPAGFGMAQIAGTAKI